MPQKAEDPRFVQFTRLPKALQRAGIARIERKQQQTQLMTRFVTFSAVRGGLGRYQFDSFKLNQVNRRGRRSRFCCLGHSCRSASIGSIRAARRAGKYPKTTPIPAENTKDSTLIVGLNR